MHTHQSFTNTVRTTVLLAALGGALVLAGAAIGSSIGAFIGLGVGLVAVGGSYWFSDRLAIRAAHAVPLSESEAPQVYRSVRRLCEHAKMPMPAIYRSPSNQPNAFATGRNERHAAVCVTDGILPLLDDDELEGVLAHELSHVRNHDILIGSIAAALAMGITTIARLAMWGSLLGGNRRRNSGLGGAVSGLAMMILAPFAAMAIQMSISRSREFEADHSGALLAGSGTALARALSKIERAAASTPMNIDAAHATAYIINPLTGRSVNFANLFRTHPDTAERIARLKAIH